MNSKTVTLVAMFAALCGVGALVKVPLGISSTALDSAPVLLSVAFLPPVLAGYVGLIGHFATAFTSGFALGPLHIIIAVEMFIIIFLFAKLHRTGKHLLKWVFFISANGFLAIIPFYFLLSPQFFFAAIPSILLATIVNAVIGMVTMPLLEKWTMRIGELQ